MNDYELLEKRVMPSLIEEERAQLTDECIPDLIKIARTFEPDETSAPVIVEKEFRLTRGDSRGEFKPENYSFETYSKHLFIALDLTNNHNPNVPLLEVIHSDFGLIGGSHKNKIGMRNARYAKLEEIKSEGNQLYVIPRIMSYENFVVNSNFDLFKTRYEDYVRQKIKREKETKTGFWANSPSPTTFFAVEILRVPIEELKRYQESAYQIDRAEEALERTLEPLRKELIGIQQKIADIEQPERDRILEDMDKLYQESLGTKFNITLGVPTLTAKNEQQ